jgi:phage protein D/phage baseplate assembly protein gpV
MPSGATEHLAHFYLYFDGALDSEMQDDLLSVTIESSLHLPDTATLVLNDPQLKWVDHDKVMPGKQLKIQAESGGGPATVFEGELVELEPHFEPEGMKLTIRAFDKMHRLTRGRFVKSFVDVKDSDIMKKVIEGAGLQAQVTETTVIHKHVMQGNQTNFEFLRERAGALGYFMYAEGNTIHCEPPSTAGVAAELQWHQNLGDFRPRLSTVGMVSEVNVRGWDPKNKSVVTATQNQGQGAPKIGVNQTGSEIARSAHNINATYLVNEPLPRDTAAATVLAKAVADRLIGHFVEADGTCGGDPKILAGQKVKISRVGTRFSGEYFITSATHIYQQKLGYVTHFSVSGQNPSSLLSSLSDRREYRAPPSITVALVTDNQDPENMNRVKLKYPTFSDQDSSYWARIATPDAGNNRGVQFLPEVNDEVLVAFEQGDINQPYVIGSLWNGSDAPPQTASEAKDKRMIRSRSGHVIILDDTDGSEKIIIKDKTGSNVVQIDSSSNEMKISMEGETKIIAKGKISLESQQDISIKATNGVKIEGMDVEVKGQTGVKVSGLQVDVKADAALQLQGGAMAELKAPMVKIN